MQPTVIITETLDPAYADWLGQHVNVVWCPHDQTQKLHEHLAAAEGLLVRTYTQVNEALLNKAPKLRVVGRAGVGLDNIDLEACRQRNIAVVYTPDANTQAVVEYVLGLMLDTFRPRTSLMGYVPEATFHELRQTEVGMQLEQLTLGIVGFGRIGKRLGKVAHALGMKLLVCDLLDEQSLRDAVDYPFTFVDHARLYADSHVVTLHVDARTANRQMINADTLAHLRDDCLLINTARGMLIDNAALADWALRHPNARVALDVHDPEPMPEDYPLFDLPNVRLLPHLASRTHEALQNMSSVAHDVVTVLQGKPPLCPAFP